MCYAFGVTARLRPPRLRQACRCLGGQKRKIIERRGTTRTLAPDGRDAPRESRCYRTVGQDKEDAPQTCKGRTGKRLDGPPTEIRATKSDRQTWRGQQILGLDGPPNLMPHGQVPIQLLQN
jgi:hypothetical protein